MNNWVEISESRLAANYHALQSAAGGSTEVLAVIKANAYGHGAELCAPILVRAGARWLGVTCAAEGARVRTVLNAQHLQADILVMCGFLDGDVPLILAHDLTPVVWTHEHLAWLASSGTRVHVEVDTGMGRQGVPPGPELDRLLGALLESNLVLDGIFTHFCSSEQANSPLTQLQQHRFEAAVARIHSLGLSPAWLHAGNSSTLDNPAQQSPWLGELAAIVDAHAMVRTGLALYGYCLPIDGDAAPQIRPALGTVLTWRASILAVRNLAPGDTVGYNATFTATHAVRIALLAVGYADGLRRELSAGDKQTGGYVLIQGRLAPMLGRISMNLTVVDVTGLGDVQMGDAATLLGDGITAEDHARLAHTIAYEILCGIHPSG